MDLIDDIEKGFDLVDEINFQAWNMKGTNNWISLKLFNTDNLDKILDAYEKLRDVFKEGKGIMVLYEGQYHMTISFINEKTNDIVTIKNKRFNFDNFDWIKKNLRDDEPIDLRIETTDLINHIKGHFLFFFVLSTRNSP